MKFSYGLLVITAAIIVVNANTLPRDSECEFTKDGDRWRKSCNWCSCTDTHVAVCTRKGCPPDFEIRIQGEKQCEGDAKWKVDCNWCHCEEGNPVCTEIACEDTTEVSPDPSSIRSEPLNQFDLEGECLSLSEDASWKNECNWCKCSTKKLAQCTRKGCRPNFQEKSESTPDCTGEVRWKKDCNTCQCVNGESVCSVEHCNKDPSDTRLQDIKPVCNAGPQGGRYKNDCNWCNCDNYGLGMCTKIGCIRAPSDTRQSPPVCEGDVTWKYDDCNFCKCVNNESICTTNQCDRSASDSAACSDGQTWVEGCNTCSCLKGLSFCTRMLCSEGRQSTIEPSVLMSHAPSVISLDLSAELKTAECKEGSRWSDGCNSCGCSNGVSICTLRACLPGTGAEMREPLCEEGSHWKDDCNVCNCGNGLPICTRRLCPSGTKNIAKELFTPVVRKASIGQNRALECTEGSHWKNECNGCFCSNGLGACTKKFCLPGRTASSGPECEDGSQWRAKDCSWCKCEGQKAVCTPGQCNQNTEVKPAILIEKQLVTIESTGEEPEKTCEKGSRWRKLCNWCTCGDNGVGICEQKGCLNDAARSLHGTCEGESRWLDECNWCKCINGRGVCTLKGCLSSEKQLIPAVRSESVCEDGNNWMEDCNTCLCTNGVVVCTRRACIQQRSKTCVEGENWKDHCNSCQCIKGQIACTKKFCEVGRSIDIPEICNLPSIDPNAKLCGGFETKWTYVAEKGVCEEIVYGGCGGTENLFPSEEDCYTTCGKSTVTAVKEAVNPRERCYLPIVSGPCFGLFSRYAYFPDKNRCEKFLYGGCQGNQNNFRSTNECHDVCGGSPPTIEMSCDRSKCDWKRYAHYIVKECQPVYEGGLCCPTSFECAGENANEQRLDRCYYKGKEYQPGDNVPVDDDCMTECRCREASTLGAPAEINCADIECPSLFRRLEPGCRYLYTLGKCCETDTECTSPDTPPQLELRSVQCTWKDKNWKLGSEMYFEEDEPCQKCVCTSEFTDPKGPGCEKIECGYDTRYSTRIFQKCSPIFFEDKCCPIDWICPGDDRLTEVVAGAQGNQVLRSGECMLGNMTVPLGGTVTMSDCRMKCSCVSPTELTCVQYRSCEIADQSKLPKDESLDCPELKCSSSCTTAFDPLSGCPKCFCKNLKFTCSKPTCPPQCVDPVMEFNEDTGCYSCKCSCRTNFKGEPNCPMDCITKTFFDDQTGCHKCVCDANKSREEA